MIAEEELITVQQALGRRGVLIATENSHAVLTAEDFLTLKVALKIASEQPNCKDVAFDFDNLLYKLRRDINL